MLDYIDRFPVELIKEHFLSSLCLVDLVQLERAACREASRTAFLQLLQHNPPVVLSDYHKCSLPVLQWFNRRRCRIDSIMMESKNLISFNFDFSLVNSVVLKLEHATSMSALKRALGADGALKVRSLILLDAESVELVKCLPSLTPNIIHIKIMKYMSKTEWLTEDLLAQWKIERFEIYNSNSLFNSIIFSLEKCSQLRFLHISSNYINMDDYKVNYIKIHFPKLECLRLKGTLSFDTDTLLTLGESGLPLKSLDIPEIPIFPSAEVAVRCVPAISCIQTLRTAGLRNRGVPAQLLLPYLTGLTAVNFNSEQDQQYIDSIAAHCHKLESICIVRDPSSNWIVAALLPWFPYLVAGSHLKFTDTTLIELIHACPHLHTLKLPYETAITDTGILALSEHCPQLQHLDIGQCTQVTDIAVLALSKRCRRLIYLNIGSCTDITDTSVLALSERCHLMETLCIQSSKYVTEAAVVDILQRCTQLSVLLFSDRNCQAGSVHRLQQQYPGKAVAQHCTTYWEILGLALVCVLLVWLIYTVLSCYIQEFIHYCVVLYFVVAMCMSCAILIDVLYYGN